MSSGSQTIDDVAARLSERLQELRAIGADADGGVTRLAYTAEERAAHELLVKWVDARAWEHEADAAGNTIAVVREGTPYFLVGSHLDSVRHGGAYDGAAGVVAALEVAALLEDELTSGLRVVAFAAEEGARFGRPNLGSAAAAGLLDPAHVDQLRDAEGVSLRAAASALGLDPTSITPWINGDVACFFEIHIEQGRQLELTGARLGIVDAIAGSIRFRIDVVGRADHSGATPMRGRADALAAASEVILAAERLGRQHRSSTVTVGRLTTWPNSVTTIPGRVALWVDVRDVDPDQQRCFALELGETARELVAGRGLGISIQLISNQRPIILDLWLRSVAQDVCLADAVAHRIFSSGAGHDAAVVAERAPAALLFIPCADGVSHAPAESARVEDLALAVRVAASALRRADVLLL
jgi:allantoate deiminase/N-carbamoyl-L-amino-acid hydrolase